MKLKKDCWLQTYIGKQFFPFDPKLDDIDIIDIAFSLGKKCRFNGHTINGFYSVAEHSLLVCKLLEDINSSISECLWGLMHDAVEAYTGDIPKPIKPFLNGFHEIENRIQKCIAEKFNLVWPMPNIVKSADEIILSLESLSVMKTPHPADWHVAAIPSGLSIKFNQLSWIEATKEFLNKCIFYNLISENEMIDWICGCRI